MNWICSFLQKFASFLYQLLEGNKEPQKLLYRNGLLVSNEVVVGTHLRGCTSIQNKLFGLDLPQ